MMEDWYSLNVALAIEAVIFVAAVIWIISSFFKKAPKDN